MLDKTELYSDNNIDEEIITLFRVCSVQTVLLTDCHDASPVLAHRVE